MYFVYVLKEKETGLYLGAMIEREEYLPDAKFFSCKESADDSVKWHMIHGYGNFEIVNVRLTIEE